jgi:hypothetical protein
MIRGLKKSTWGERSGRCKNYASVLALADHLQFDIYELQLAH